MAKNDGPIPFSTIVGKTKMAAKTLDEVREKGVTFDLDIEQTPPEVEMDVLVDVDIEAEKLKAENCPYWEYEEFVGSFEFKDLENEYKEPLIDLLWSFRHVFHNEKHNEQFRKGLRMKPINIERIPGASPKKEKFGKSARRN